MNTKFLYGGDYNPEQWLEYPEILEKDIELMKKAKINTVTLGMFSWSTLEPQENLYNFQWLEDIISKLEKNEINVILGTPSGAKPAWLGQKYSQVRRVRKDGIRELHGNRHNFCTNSPIYREKVKNINERLAKLSLKFSNIIMWHISNEFGQECHCDLCQEKFRKWLKDKYKTIENLNHSWWTTFWSHTYSSFDEIFTPMTIGEMSVTALKINYQNFMTQNFIDFYNFEKDCIEKINGSLPFTTNYHGTGKNDIDYREFSKYVDIISYDSYPEWQFKDNVEVAFETSFNFDLMRSTNLKKQFLLMESCPSATNWQTYSKLKPNNLLTMASLQAIAHSSFGVLYFQIRKSRGSAEKFHGAVIDHDGSPKHRVFKEVENLGKILANKSFKFEEAKTKVGLFYSWKNKYALENSEGPRNKGINYYENTIKIYKSIKSLGHNIDIIFEDSDLSKYNIIVLPMMYVLEENFAKEIEKFVNQGNVLITTSPCSYVNNDDLCHLGGFPGYLRKILGIKIEEIDSLMDNEESYISFKNKKYKTYYFNELLSLEGAEVLGEYKSFFYKGQGAITKNSYGKGKAYHIGTILDDEGFYQILKNIFEENGRNTEIDNRNILFSSFAEKNYFFNFSKEVQHFIYRGTSYKLDPLDYLIL